MVGKGDRGSGSGESQEQGAEERPSTQPEEGYPPTSVSFDGDDVVEKSEQSSEGDTVDLSERDDSDPKTSDKE